MADYWWVFLIIALVLLLLLLIFCCCMCMQRNKGDSYPGMLLSSFHPFQLFCLSLCVFNYIYVQRDKKDLLRFLSFLLSLSLFFIFLSLLYPNLKLLCFALWEQATAALCLFFIVQYSSSSTFLLFFFYGLQVGKQEVTMHMFLHILSHFPHFGLLFLALSFVLQMTNV